VALSGVSRRLKGEAPVEILPNFRLAPLDVSPVVAHCRNLSRRIRAFMAWIEEVRSLMSSSVFAAIRKGGSASDCCCSGPQARLPGLNELLRALRATASAKSIMGSIAHGNALAPR